MSTVTLTKANFGETILQDGVVFVDCWAPWCGPCRMFGPVFEGAAERHPEHTFGKLNTEEEGEVAGALSIQSIPTLMIFRDGIQVFRQAGALPEAALDDLVAQAEALDMDKVRAEMAEQQAEKETVAG